MTHGAGPELISSPMLPGGTTEEGPHPPSTQARLQEDQYHFPYHHIPQWEDGAFRQARQLDWGFEYASYVSFLLDRLGTIPFQSLLDVGCGDGRFLAELSRRNPDTALTGIDVSPRAILFARALVPQVHWVCGDVTKPGIVPRADAATLIETLEHIPPGHIPAFLDGIGNLLEPGAALLVTVPSKNLPLQDKHFQHFDEESLTAALAPHFRIEELYWVNRSVRYLSRIYRRVLSNSVFILNHEALLRRLYAMYLDRLFHAGPKNGTRLVAVCRKVD